MQQIIQHSQKLLSSVETEFQRFFLKDDPFPARMSVLLGQRGVGKTTLLLQYLLMQTDGNPLSDKVLYVPSDHFFMKGLALYEVADEFLKMGGEILCLDEIHKYPNWSQELKSIFDSFAELKVVASGSSALELYRGSHDLTRRAIQHRLYGLSFREYLEMKTAISFPVLTYQEILENHVEIGHEIVNKLGNQSLKILPLFREYLKVGYYPFIRQFPRHDSLYYQVLEQNVHTIIESDLLSIYPSLTGVSIAKIKQLLSFLAYQTPYKVDFAKLMRALEISHPDILKKYLKYLVDADVLCPLLDQGKSMSSFEKPQKLYHSNTNQLYAMAADSANIGTIRETFFVSAFKPVMDVSYSKEADFSISGQTFEVGGKNKNSSQLKGTSEGYLALDDIEHGFQNRIPLWLFGFLY